MHFQPQTQHLTDNPEAESKGRMDGRYLGSLIECVCGGVDPQLFTLKAKPQHKERPVGEKRNPSIYRENEIHDQ